MSGLLKRGLNGLGNLDRAVAALFGARFFQTVSGSAGRACGLGGGDTRWWGPSLRWLIDIEPWFGRGHCQRWAEAEQRFGEALAQAGIADI